MATFSDANLEAFSLLHSILDDLMTIFGNVDWLILEREQSLIYISRLFKARKLYLGRRILSSNICPYDRLPVTGKQCYNVSGIEIIILAKY